MKNILIVVFTLILVSCSNTYKGKELSREISICKQITEYNKGKCEYLFISKYQYFKFYSDCGKWQIGDTL